jgi:hypothetical protein
MEKVGRWLGGRLQDVRAFIDGLYENDLHAKRVDALAGATLGVMTSASLAVAVIGQALAQARGLVTKHAIKQVDRLLSNQNIDVWDSFAHWVPHLIGARKEIVVAMDSTDFDRDGQATLALNLVTRHGRATPLMWVTVWKDELTKQRNDFVDACLLRLKELVPSGCAVTILADRGFGDQSFSSSSMICALTMSSGSAAIFTSPMPRAKPVRLPTGLARRGGLANCAALWSPHRTHSRSAQSSVCMPRR